MNGAVVTTIGLVFDIIGAITVGYLLIVPRRKAGELATPQWDMHEEQLKDRLAQSKAAIWGLSVLALGFFLQLAGVWVK